MAKQNAGFVHEHIEKVVIGAGALFFLWAVYYSFMGGRFALNGKAPSEIIADVGNAADSAIQTVQNSKAEGDESGVDAATEKAVEQLLAWYGPQRQVIGEILDVKMDVARTQPFPPPFVSATEVNEQDRHDLARLVDPDVPVVLSGRSTLKFPVEVPELSEYSGPSPNAVTDEITVNWVAVAAQVNLKQQEINFKTQKYPASSYLNIVKVHLQRFDEDEPWRGWQDVDTYLAFKEIERGSASKLRDLIDFKQEFIARPLLPERASGDKIEYDFMPYLDSPPSTDEQVAPRLAKKWIDRARKAIEGKDPYGGKDYHAAMILARAAMTTRGIDGKTDSEAKKIYADALRRVTRRDYKERDKAPSDQMMPIVAYDLTATPSHAYRYRIRYEVWNQFAGKDGELKNKRDAGLTTLMSDWSPESRRVRLTPDTQFFLTDANSGRNAVEVAVWKKNRRSWVKENFRFGIGEPIGGKNKDGDDFTTGAICVDIRFDEPVNGKRDTVLVYQTPDGALREAVLSVDEKLSSEFAKRARG